MKKLEKSKIVDVRILHGLPGSGKTTFSQNELKEKARPFACYFFDVDDIWIDDPITHLRKHIYNVERDLFREKIKDELCRINLFSYSYLVIDGLFLTNQMIIDLIEDTISSLETDELGLTFTIDTWNEDRELCKLNDILRKGRWATATQTIETAPFEKVDLNAIKGLFPTYEINVCNHEVYQSTDKEKFFAKGEISIKEQDALRSDTWSGGGDIGTCWDNFLRPIEKEDPPERFYELDAFLESVGITLSDEDYEYIFDYLVNIEENIECDYYGGAARYDWYEIYLDSLYDFLKEHNYIK